MRRGSVILAVAILALLPGPEAGWGNDKTHLELTDAAVLHSDRMEQTLREVYGLPEGLETMLAPQRGFARDAGLEEVEEDLGVGTLISRPRIPVRTLRIAAAGVLTLGVSAASTCAWGPTWARGIRGDRTSMGCARRARSSTWSGPRSSRERSS